jgi:hypothetical protein
MVRFQKFITIYFSLYTCTTFTVSSGNHSSTSSSHIMLNAGPRDQFPRWRRSRRRLPLCSVYRCPYPWLQCSVSFMHGLKKTFVLCGASFYQCTKLTLLSNHRSGYLRKLSPTATPSWKVFNRPRSKHETRTAGSLWETWTVSAANTVYCFRMG